MREYNGVQVFEGSYITGRRIVPSWGGSMFEALMVPLFVPEDNWAPRSWGINHPLYAHAQIAHGLEEAGYGYWGFSPAASPRGGYQVYGVDVLGTYSKGYLSYEVGPPVEASTASHAAHSAHGVVTPYASFLALRYARARRSPTSAPFPRPSRFTRPWASWIRSTSRREWRPVASWPWTKG